MERDVSVAVIVPSVVVHHLDPHTGIPFMPHIAAYLAAVLRGGDVRVQVLDSFGLQPHQREIIQEFMLLGLPGEEIAQRVLPTVEICFIYCRTMSESIAVMRLIHAIKKYRKGMKICLFENTQAVTSFSLRDLAEVFLKNGCDIILMGNPEKRALELVQCLISNGDMSTIAGISYRGEKEEVCFTPPAEAEKHFDDLPFPAWDLFPLRGYWIVGFAHAPIKDERFLPILTSRGCPYHCRFCIAPALNYSWAPRSASNVVDEMEHFYNSMGVRDFHISDLNPTVDDARTRQICREIIHRKLPITWKLAQGTKIETIKDEETLELMAKAGCVYISFSPETGSKRMLKMINKPFDFSHALKMLRKMNELRIRTQACFISGLPGENAEDRAQTLAYVKELVREGLDEINVPIFTPVPGSAFSTVLQGYTSYAQCTFSPTWRSDYKETNRFRYRMYLTFFLFKLKRPFKILREIRGFLTGKFETKMEMSFFKLLKLFGLRFFPWAFRTLKYDSSPSASQSDL